MPREIEMTGVLGDTAPHGLPQRVVDEASRLAGSAVAAYVIDLDGSCVIRLAGDAEHYPDRIVAPLGVAPEVPLESLPRLRSHIADALGTSTVAPLVVRERVVGLLVSRE